MIKLQRRTSGIFLAAVMLASAGCSASGNEPSESTTPPPASKLDPLDMCSVFRPEEIKNFGLTAPGEGFSDKPGEPGCDFTGEEFDVSVAKNAGQTVESYGKDARWASYEPVSVNGRSAAQAISASATDARMCFTLFDAGGGVIVVNSTEVDDGDLDECAQSLKIAESIEPRMPR